MRERNKGLQQEQQNTERGTSNSGYEKVRTSREQQNQRGSQQSQQQQSGNLEEQSDNSRSGRGSMNEPESI